MSEEIKFCDLMCKYASFPESNALDGACRREISLYCAKYRQLVPKNAVCLDFREKSKNKN
ncbi:hypothetical protein [Thermotomaculum hydrothermale]|uniref:hypothetical protein n=1 Tax=Thermotomaculum hydrothermale TaxID=981385 RepID=UPI0019161612|nr:hypothetical protein [Thermotomaculum hydrothermale]